MWFRRSFLLFRTASQLNLIHFINFFPSLSNQNSFKSLSGRRNFFRWLLLSWLMLACVLNDILTSLLVVWKLHEKLFLKMHCFDFDYSAVKLTGTLLIAISKPFNVIVSAWTGWVESYHPTLNLFYFSQLFIIKKCWTRSRMCYSSLVLSDNIRDTAKLLFVK